MIFLGSRSSFKTNSINEIIIDDKSLLLISHNNQYYLIENKCGHFGVPLIEGKIKGDEIICPQHHISFSLKSGAVINRPYENCDKIQVFKVVQQDNDLYMDEDDFSEGKSII